MWISWSWPSAVNAEEEGTESRGTISTSDTALRNHPILLLFEKSNVLSKIEVTRLKSKRRLCFSHNDDGSTELERLPEVLWECNDLEKLYLSGNSIKQVIESEFKVKGNDFREASLDLQLPPEVSNLENLTVLSLANNLLESFPEEITFLVQLKWLNLSGNYIPEIPESIQRIRYLEVLWCNNARVNSVDAAIGNCYHLNTLGLRGNEIGLLPNTFSELANLTWITLENNQLKSLPSSMSMLQNLVHLNLQNNCIEVLPDFLYKIRGLKYVFLNSNRIQAVRLIDLYHTNHLNVFDLNHNPFPDEHIIPVLKVSY